jgi:putative inorganic carbon (HCO3(-)) transporter
VIALLALAVGVLSAFDVYAWLQWYDQQRTALLVCLIIVAARQGLLRTELPGDWRITSLLLAAVGFGVVSVAGAGRGVPAVAEWATVALLFAVVARGAGHHGHHPAARFAAFSFIAVAAPYVVAVIVKYIVSVAFGESPGADTFQLFLSNPRFPAQMEALTLPLAPIAFHLVRDRRGKSAVAVVGALWWMCVFGSASRTAWIALMVSFVAVTVLPGRSRQWLTVQASLIAGGFAAYVALFYLVPDLLGLHHRLETGRFESMSSFVARLQLYELCLALFQSAPWFGWGPMHFAAVNNEIAAHPHNFWLQHLAEWGILSTGCVVMAFLLLAWGLVKSRTEPDLGPNHLRDVTLTGLLAGLIAWAVGCLADGYMVMPTSQALSAVVLALCVSVLPAVPASERVLMVTRWGWRICTLAAIAGLCYVATTPFGDPLERQRLWAAENSGSSLLAPRFWQQGWIGPDADPTAR